MTERRTASSTAVRTSLRTPPTTPGAACWSSSGASPERRRRPARVRRVEVRPGRDDLVDAVEELVVERDVERGELALELLHRARSDDRGGHGGVPDHERDRELDQGSPGGVGQP